MIDDEFRVANRADYYKLKKKDLYNNVEKFNASDDLDYLHEIFLDSIRILRFTGMDLKDIEKFFQFRSKHSGQALHHFKDLLTQQELGGKLLNSYKNKL